MWSIMEIGLDLNAVAEVEGINFNHSDILALDKRLIIWACFIKSLNRNL